MTDKDMHESPGDQQAREKISVRAREAADAIRKLVLSIGMEVEERIAIQDQVDNISKETESVLDRLDAVAKKNQRKVLLAYKTFLERNLEAVDQRLKESE